MKKNRVVCLVILLSIPLMLTAEEGLKQTLNSSTVQVKVLIEGREVSRGSGFLCSFRDKPVVITSYHVVYTPDIQRHIFDYNSRQKAEYTSISIEYQGRVISLGLLKDCMAGFDETKDFALLTVPPGETGKKALYPLETNCAFTGPILYKQVEKKITRKVQFYHYPYYFEKSEEHLENKRYYEGTISSIVWPPADEPYKSSHFIIEIQPGIISYGTSGSSCIQADTGRWLGIVNWEYKQFGSDISGLGYVSIISVHDIAGSIDRLAHKNSAEKLDLIVDKSPGGTLKKVTRIKKLYTRKKSPIHLAASAQSAFFTMSLVTAGAAVPFAAVGAYYGITYNNLPPGSDHQTFRTNLLCFNIFTWTGAGIAGFSLTALIGFIISTALYYYHKKAISRRAFSFELDGAADTIRAGFAVRLE